MISLMNSEIEFVYEVKISFFQNGSFGSNQPSSVSRTNAGKNPFLWWSSCKVNHANWWCYPLSCYLLAFVMLKYLECSVAFVVNAILSFCRVLKTRTSFLPELLLEIVFKNFIWCYISDCFSRMFCQFHVLVFSSLMKSCYKVEMVRPKFFLPKLFIDILCNCFYNDY